MTMLADAATVPWLQATDGRCPAALLRRLMQQACAQVRDVALAEDAVAEAVLAALSARRAFDSPSQAAAWLFVVLRHKVVDQLRQQHRETPAGDMAAALAQAGAHQAWHGAGAWHGDAQAWQDPEQAGVQRQFITVLAACCSRLPPAQSRAFILREVCGFDACAISSTLGVTESHLWVLLHRARRRLQAMLPGCWPVLTAARCAG